MLRVVLGRARPDTEWSGRMSGLQFNSAPGIQGSSVRSRGVTSTIRTVPRSYGEEVDMEGNGDLGPRTEALDLGEETGKTKEEGARV
jgi:hypothetical protein